MQLVKLANEAEEDTVYLLEDISTANNARRLLTLLISSDELNERSQQVDLVLKEFVWNITMAKLSGNGYIYLS